MLNRRQFIQSTIATYALSRSSSPLWARERGSDKVIKGHDYRDEPEESHGGPLNLKAWPYGRDSTATNAMLTFRGNPSHTFYGTGPISDKAPQVLWRHRMIDFPSLYYGKPHVWRGTGWTGQPIYYQDYIFIGSQGCHFYAFEAKTGKLRWRFKGGRQFKGSACLYQNKLYTGNVDDWLRCIDANTGKVLWRINTGRDLDSSPIVVDDKLYIAGENGHARCLDPHTGELIWKTFVGGINRGRKTGSYGSETSPAVVNGAFYCATYDGDAFKIDAQNGEIIWKVSTEDDTDSSPVIRDGKVYFASQEKAPYLHCFDEKTGKRLWRFKNRSGFWSTPAVDKDNAYIAGDDETFYAIDVNTGKARWQVNLKAKSWSSPALIDNKLIFGDFSGYLWCLSAADGKQIWKKKLGGRIHSTPCIIDGSIYIGTGSGRFYALK